MFNFFKTSKAARTASRAADARSAFLASFLPEAEQKIATWRDALESINVMRLDVHAGTAEHNLPLAAQWACAALRERGYTVEVDYCGGVQWRQRDVGIFVVFRRPRRAMDWAERLFFGSAP